MKNSIPVKVEVKGEKVVVHFSKTLSRVYNNVLEYILAKEVWVNDNLIILEEEGILHFDPNAKLRDLLLDSDLEEENED